MHCLADEEHCLLNIFFQLKKKRRVALFHYITEVHKKNGCTDSGLYDNYIIIRKRFPQDQKIGQMI